MNKLSLSLFLTTIILSTVGIFILYESSTYTAALNIGDKYYFVKNQSIWLALGITLSIFVSRINYKRYYKLALPMLLGSLVLLVLVFLPGIGLELKGAHRWINLGFTVLQPSEIMKVSMTLYLAAWLSVKENGRVFAFLILLSISVLLVILEPDMGTAFIIASTSTIVYFLSGASLKEMGVILLIVVVGLLGLLKMEPYRIQRLASFQNFDTKDLATTSYHVKQIILSLGSGGLTGVGFGKSVQKYAYLPENTTDSIFAIYSEEAGFIGSVILISLFFIQLILGFMISVHSPDMFGRLIAVGVTSFIGIQTLINLASQVVLIPLTGIPLPFISYGGSSLIINFISIGILLNIARKKNLSFAKKRRL